MDRYEPTIPAAPTALAGRRVPAPALGATGSRGREPDEVTALEVLAAVRDAATLLAGAAHADLTGQPSAALSDLVDALDHARRLLDAAHAHALAAHESDGTWALSGHRSYPAYLTTTHATRRSTTGALVRRARALRDHLPHARAALADGHISAEHVDVLARETLASDRLRRTLAQPGVGEDFLVRTATALTVDQFSRVVKTWATRADPEAADTRFHEQNDAQTLTISPTTDGCHIHGWLTAATGEKLMAGLDAIIGNWDSSSTQTRPQRYASAFSALLDTALDAGAITPHAVVRPHLVATVPAQTFWALQRATSAPQAPGGVSGVAAARELPEAVIPGTIDHAALFGVEPATYSHGAPLAPAELSLLACEGEWTRVVLGAPAEILDLGKAVRLFSKAQRLALHARDAQCQFPGCSAPPRWCQAHHMIWVEHGGASDMDNAILLCKAHHAAVHAQHLSIARHPDRWEFLRPDGTLHSTRRRTVPGHPHQPPLPPPPLPPLPPAPHFSAPASRHTRAPAPRQATSMPLGAPAPTPLPVPAGAPERR